MSFLELVNCNPTFHLFFVNDGSTDNTSQILSNIQNSNPKQINIITLGTNVGKGNAIRLGAIIALESNYNHIAYIDADLSTPIWEFVRLTQLLDLNRNVVIASRIKKAGSTIKRSLFRHFIGRVIATILDLRFELGIYDTQCGTKIFESELLKISLKQPFLTSWFFDVEILLRLRKHQLKYSLHEEPLNCWKHEGNSKLTVFSSAKVFKELIVLIKNY